VKNRSKCFGTHYYKAWQDLGIINSSFLCSSTTSTTIKDTHHCHLLATIVSSPPSPPCHHHIVITVTGCLPPHPLPTSKTTRMTWQHHITNQMSTGCIDATQQHRGFRCHIASCDVATPRQMTMMFCLLLLFIFLHNSKSLFPPSSQLTL